MDTLNYIGDYVMPTPSLMEIPKSRSAEEFECLCTDILTQAYNQRFLRYGRNGQKQNGIDIYASPDNEHYIVAQCKNYFLSTSTKNIVKQIEKDAKAAEISNFNISKFIVMTAMNRDKYVQDSVVNIDSSFNIELWFWEDIQEKACSNTKLLHDYYPNLFENTQIPIMVLNEMISNLAILKDTAQSFNERYKNYRVGYHQQDDISLYNHCAEMFVAAAKIYGLKNQWLLQCQKIGASDIIEKIIRNVPDFHDENQDGTGATMIYTIGNFLDYFCLDKSSDENSFKFIKHCNKVIKKLNKS